MHSIYFNYSIFLQKSKIITFLLLSKTYKNTGDPSKYEVTPVVLE